MPNHHGNYIKL